VRLKTVSGMRPQWRGRLEVTEVELDHEHTSLN
jgi:hypothetical protein